MELEGAVQISSAMLAARPQIPENRRAIKTIEKYLKQTPHSS